MSSLVLKSNHFKPLELLKKEHEFNGFDGEGQNLSPSLYWEGNYQDAKSFAITLYDPDAPTGSGFWHWVLFDIPANVTSLQENLESFEGKSAYNDFGIQGYGGPCPPKGSKHRYIFKLHALSTESIGVDENTPNAIIRFLINSNTIASSEITTFYAR